MSITSVGNHGAGGISERRRSSCSSFPSNCNNAIRIATKYFVF